MSITLEVPEDIARAARREAQQSGTPLESLLLQALAAHFAPVADENRAVFLEKQEIPYKSAAATSHPTLAEMQAKNAETIAYLLFAGAHEKRDYRPGRKCAGRSGSGGITRKPEPQPY